MSDLFTEPLEEFRNGLFIEEKKWAQYKHHPLRLVVPLTDHSLHETGANLVTLPNTDCKAHLTGQNVITLEGERLLPQGMSRSYTGSSGLPSYHICKSWQPYTQIIIGAKFRLIYIGVKTLIRSVDGSSN